MFSKRMPVVPFFLLAGALAGAAAQAAVPLAPRKQTKRLGMPLNRSKRWPAAGSYQHARTLAPQPGRPVR